MLLHLAESTVVAGILAAVNVGLRRFRISAAARHRIWLLAFAKFAVPSALLWSAGSRLSVFIPVRPVLQLPTADISRLLQQTGPHVTHTISQTSYAWVAAIVCSVWITGALVTLVVWLRRLRRSALPVSKASEAAQDAFCAAKRQLAIDGKVEFTISAEATEPILLGITNPVVVLPASLEKNLNSAELNAVLLHELAHFVRRDNLIGSLAHLITAAFWFHPLLWWMERQVSADCEYACDEVVLTTANEPAAYAAGIAKATRFGLCGAFAGVSGIATFEIQKRLDLIMSQNETSFARRSGRSLVTAIVTALVLIPLAGGFASKGLLRAQTIEKRRGIEFISASASASTPQTRQILAALKTLLNAIDRVFPSTAGDRGEKWNKDLASLITPEENAAFLALKTDDEREQFVNQFWEKRNPNPGSAVNTSKEEHDRRVAYATKHFTVQQAAGWETDRGRTYIAMGPPDEIDSHPDQNRETWTYRLRGSTNTVTILFDTSDQRK